MVPALCTLCPLHQGGCCPYCTVKDRLFARPKFSAFSDARAGATNKAPIRIVSRLLPSRYLVSGLKDVFLKGGGLSIVAWDAAALVLFTFAMLAVAYRRLRLRLD